MRWMLPVPILILGLSCATSNPPPAQSQQSGLMNRPERLPGEVSTYQAPTPAPKPAARERAPITASAAPGNAKAAPVPPKDAQFTIYIQDVTGPAHVEVANKVKSDLAQSSGLRGWYCIHQPDRSSLFYGYYKEPNETAIRRDRAAIERMNDKFGNKLFRSVVVVPVDAPDPTAPPDWDLTRLRRSDEDVSRFWTIQVGAYKDSPQRKQYAVDAVRDARESGIEAYFYHGESVSSVCIGAWPKDAVRIEGMEELPDNLQNDRGLVAGVGNKNPDDAVIVMPGIKIGASDKRMLERDRGVTVAQPSVTIVDSRMASIKQQFNEHAVNGDLEVVTNSRGERIPKPSMVVQIPSPTEAGSLAVQTPSVAAPPPEAVQAISPDRPAPAPGSGRLRSIGK